MDSGSDLYYDIVLTYIRVIERDSPEAAAAVEEILSIYGSRAALRATLVITILKMEVQKNQSVEDINIQTHLIKSFPGALPLLERAVACCVQAWGISLAEPGDRGNGHHASADEEAASSIPLLPPV